MWANYYYDQKSKGVNLNGLSLSMRLVFLGLTLLEGR